MARAPSGIQSPLEAPGREYTSVQTQRFSVEFDRRTVGIAVRVPGGFIFYSSARAFDALDGKLFRRARSIERTLKKHARQQRGGAFGAGPIPAFAGAGQ